MRGFTTENDPILARLQGRIDYLLMVGRVKDPELMQSAREALSDLSDATKCLLDSIGEPRDQSQANLIARCRAAIQQAA